VIPLILAIDTTGPQGSIALASGDRLLQEMPLHAPDGYSEILFGAIGALLARNAVTIEEIVLFAAASGPGTFTGVRVGLACIKGLAEATARAVCAVSNLEALASFGSRARRAAVLDARRGEVYAAVYDAAGHPLVSECLTSREAFVLDPDIEVVAYEGPLAAAIARIAWRRLQTGDVSDPAEIEANYIRRSDAELHLSVGTPSSPPRK
jgi:tRNA threonylcarbamoyladenosine biosynthesis protein TsaB